MKKLFVSLKGLIKKHFLDYLYLLVRNLTFRIPFVDNLFFKLDSIRVPNKEFFGSKNREFNRITQESQNIFDNLVAVVKNIEDNYSIKKKQLLEIGPGDNFLLDFIFLLNGASNIYLIDRFKTSINNTDHFKLFNYYITNHSQFLNDNHVKNAKDLFKKIHYFSNSPIETFNKLKRSSIDLIFSHDVLEHVSDIESAIETISLLLRKGGYTIHQIDLRDHLHLNDGCYLDFLKFSSRFWKYFGDITNRHRYSKYIELFKKYNLEILHLKHTRIGPLSKINKIKQKFNSYYKNLSDEELSIIRFEIFAKKI